MDYIINDMNSTHNPSAILQKLIQFDTTNPPGNERDLILWARDLLAEAGIQSHLLAKDPNRPNLTARISGQGNAPPLLLQGHVDVVTTAGQQWDHPPFGGKIVDGEIWGRGALDMKSGVAMMVSAVLQARQKNLPLPGDIMLCLLADEEASGNFGAKFLVQDHPEQFEGVRFALGEFGGFQMEIAGQTYYPIMVAEKQICWGTITLRGPGGHGSLIHRGGSMAKLAQVLQTLDQRRLPVHITPAVKAMITGMAEAQPFPKNILLRQLLNPALTDKILGLLGEPGKLFEPLFHNTVNPTIVRGGEKTNVIPSEIRLQFDGRLLPGYQPEDMIRELKDLLGADLELEINSYDPGPADPNMGLFPVLADILRAQDPLGHPVPLVLTGVTDARFFSQLGIQTYGFIPMQLPKDFKFASLTHAANERIPIEALEFGTQAMLTAIQRFGDQ